MIAIVSPAKRLDFETPYEGQTSQPRFAKQTEALAKVMKTKQADQLRSLMGISQQLADLNVRRFQQFEAEPQPPKAKPAAFAFQGDVYQGLAANDFDEQDRAFAQAHFRILSGLYGLLRPLDLIQPYRLEMGTDLPVAEAKNLYEFWGDQIADLLMQDLDQQGDQLLINLASAEYFKAVKPKKLHCQVIQVDFQELKNGQYKVIAIHAKKARGMMARFMIKNRIRQLDDLKAFDMAGYRFDPEVSKANKLVFRRDTESAKVLS